MSADSCVTSDHTLFCCESHQCFQVLSWNSAYFALRFISKARPKFFTQYVWHLCSLVQSYSLMRTDNGKGTTMANFLEKNSRCYWKLWIKGQFSIVFTLKGHDTHKNTLSCTRLPHIEKQKHSLFFCLSLFSNCCLAVHKERIWEF